MKNEMNKDVDINDMDANNYRRRSERGLVMRVLQTPLVLMPILQMQIIWMA